MKPSKILTKKTFLLNFWLFSFIFLYTLMLTPRVQADIISENAGWVRPTSGTPTSGNTMVVNFFDAHTLAPLNPDYFSMNFYSGSGTIRNLECTSACPSSITTSSFANVINAQVRLFATKGGYQNLYTNGHEEVFDYTGSTNRIYNVYLTLNSDPPQVRVVLPHLHNNFIINYVPTETVTITTHPSFDTGASSLNGIWRTFYTNGTFNHSAPFPKAFSYTHPPGLPDGSIFLDGNFVDNSGAYSGHTGVYRIKDTVIPNAPICDVSNIGTQITIHVEASDPPEIASYYVLPGILEGELEMRTSDDGVTWSAYSLVGIVSANPAIFPRIIDQDVIVTGVPGKKYEFRWRAKDFASDQTGIFKQYSAYCNSVTVDMPPPPNHNVTVHAREVPSPASACTTTSGSAIANTKVDLFRIGDNFTGNTGAGSPVSFPNVPVSPAVYSLRVVPLSGGFTPIGYSINGGAKIPTGSSIVSLDVDANKTVAFCFVANKDPWYQTDLGDVRYPKTINPIPLTKHGSTGIPGNFPGVFFSSMDDGNYVPGLVVSPSGWKVDDEYEYTDKTGLRNGTLSHSFYIAKARQDGITPKNIPSTNINTGVLNGEYTTDSGYIFSFDGNTTVNGGLNISNIPSNKRVVILVKGNLEINSDITVEPGNLLVIAVTGDIIIDKSVGTTPGDSATFSLQGFYSAEGDIVLEGEDCNGGTPDNRLNVKGALVANAKSPFADGTVVGAGKIRNLLRSLCDNNDPYLFVSSRPDFLVQMTDFYKTTYTKWEEEKP